MNEFTSIETITEAFKRQLGVGYAIYYDHNLNSFVVSNVLNELITFDYDRDNNKFCWFKVSSSFEQPIMDHLLSIFKRFDNLNTCQKISDIFFNHEISKILFTNPIIFTKKDSEGLKITGKQIKLSPKFTFANPWNMLFVEQGYVITEDFSIRPIIDLCLNLRGFGKTRFMVDELSGEFVNVIQETNFNVNHETPSISKYKDPVVSKNTGLIRTTTLGKSHHVDIGDCINEFMDKVSPEFYTFYLNKFNEIELDSTATGTVNDFKVLEMLKV